MVLTATEESFLEDLRHVEWQFEGSDSDADKLHYAELAAGIWSAIAAIYLEKMKDGRREFPNGAKASGGSGS